MLERYFAENISLNLKMQRKMYGPELVLEIINLEWSLVIGTVVL